jgi:hypothetical protein
MSKYVDLKSGMIRDWVPVTPNNDTDNMTANSTDIVLGFVVNVAGNVVVTSSDGVDRTIAALAGVPVTMVGAKRIKAAGTGATGIFSLVI